MFGEKIHIPAPDPFRHRDTEMVTISLERYEALKNSREVLEVKDELSPVLRHRVESMNKKIQDIENDIKTYEMFLGALVAQFNKEHPDENLFHIMEDVADSLGKECVSSDDGITLTEQGIHDAIARMRQRDEHFENKTDDLPY